MVNWPNSPGCWTTHRFLGRPAHDVEPMDWDARHAQQVEHTQRLRLKGTGEARAR